MKEEFYEIDIDMDVPNEGDDKRKAIAKKTIILYVLFLLERGSCKSAPVTYTEIAHVLNSIGIPCDRKTVSRNVGYLIDFGYPIVKEKGGCYMDGSLDKEKIWMNLQNK